MSQRIVVSSALLAIAMTTGPLSAGHTRPAYLDGCQSMDGRYVVTAEPIKEKAGKKETIKWKYHWKDTKTNEAHSGWLTGPHGLGHFDVTYGHLFMPPGGETFALWLTASWAESGMPHPKGNQATFSEELAKHTAFGNRRAIGTHIGAQNGPPGIRGTLFGSGS